MTQGDQSQTEKKVLVEDLVRVTAASHPIHVADPKANAREIVHALSSFRTSQVVVFGELGLTGYTCGDLFAQDALLQEALGGLTTVVQATEGNAQLVIIGLPLRVGDCLYNTAAVIFDGQLLGLVPKQFLPNYQEFYEARWFTAADGREPSCIRLPGAQLRGDRKTSFDQAEGVPFGTDLLFQWGNLRVGIEICEDLWMPIPPSSHQALGGANLLLNLSASNETIGKSSWRDVLIRSQSGRCLAAYAYASSGPTESTTDIVFSGHCLVAENGTVLKSSTRAGDVGWLENSNATADIDLQRIAHDRQITTSWQLAVQRSDVNFRVLAAPTQDLPAADGTARRVARHPFVPDSGSELDYRCREIFGIQCAGLAKRVSCLPDESPLNIGVSGGLDSTLALLVAMKTCQQLGWPESRIRALTMPGFGTSQRTLESARELMRQLRVSAAEIDIRPLCLQSFRDLGHRPFGIDVETVSLDEFMAALENVAASRQQDLVFENVQARARTMLLMNRGFVLGTGDLSEQALGWSTYNGDHMSMYNVNTSIPKTLVKFLVRFVAENEFSGSIRDCLLGVVDTPISPELLPLGEGGAIGQHTEEVIGPYELHDFFLYHLLRFGTTPRRILQLARLAGFKDYSSSQIRHNLIVFTKRFFANQFKRSCVPDGPKVGSVSLSPRGDWRMPSDAEASAWLRDLEDEP